MRRAGGRSALVALLLVLSGACVAGSGPGPNPVAPKAGGVGRDGDPPEMASGIGQPLDGQAPTTAQVSPTEPTARPDVPSTTRVNPRYLRPAYLGTPLNELVSGTNYGVARPTPAELRDRQLYTVDVLDPPDTPAFAATVELVPSDVLARSTWQPGCPVSVDELRYLTMTFRGFDEGVHTGEMIVNVAIVEETVAVFEALFELDFPIEEMSVMPASFWTDPPTGDSNITSSFECRAAVGGSGRWSNHAFGLAIDINPFHNPYRKGELILPELAEAYLDRSHVRPGMILEGDAIVGLFDSIGWGWGGRWSSSEDYMHFSVDGR